MALPVPAAAFDRITRCGWPWLVATLLTLMLGQAALYEGGRPAIAPGGGLAQQLRAPAPDGTPLEQALLRTDTQPDTGRGGRLPGLAAHDPSHCASALAHAAVLPPAALPFPLPPLRQPPGHGPPAHG